MTSGTRFQPVLADATIADPTKVERVVLLTGKFYYDLVKARSARQELVDKVALVRVEELSPFPFHQLKQTLERYKGAKEVVWVQEEPRNQGAWGFVEGRIRNVLDKLKGEGKLPEEVKLRYRGRKEDAVPAPGVARLYQTQQKAVIESVFQDL